MRSARTTGLVIKRPSKYLLLACFTCLGIVASLAVFTLNPSPAAQAITPPDTCFGFSISTGSISSYFDNEGNNAANPACPKAVDIPDTISGATVTNIGSSAFYNKQLTSVSIPNSVTSIGDSAFSYNQLISITIPNGVTSISSYVFTGNRLTTASIPNSVTSIGDSAFSNNLLASITIPNSVTSIGGATFANNLLTSITIPSSVADIGASAFYNNKLTSLTVPASVTSIGDSAFSGNQLTNPVILGNPTGGNVFQGDPVVSISYNGTVHTIPTGSSTPATPPDPCFEFNSGTGQITNYSLFGLTALQAGAFCTDYNIVIPNTIGGVAVTSIGNAAFNGKNLTGLILPSTITSIGSSAFSSNKLTSVTIPNGVTSIGDYAFQTNQLINVSIPQSVTSIGNGAFSSNYLANVIIPSNIVSIGDHTFAYNKLSSLTLPSGVTSIGDYAFYGNRLSSLIIPNSVTTIGSSAFQSNQLTSVTLPSNLTSISSGTFQSNKLSSLVIPNSVTAIGDYAFNSNQLTNIVIPNGVMTIGNGTFQSNQLTSLTIPASVTSIGDSAFNYNNLANPVILGSPTGTNIFQNNPIASISYNGTLYPASTISSTPPDICFDINSSTGQITSYKLFNLSLFKAGTACMNKAVSIPGTIGGITVTSIGSYAFAYGLLTSIGIPVGVTDIGSGAFSNNKLTNVTIPSSVTSIGSYAFAYNQLASLVIPDGVTSIEYDAFYNNLLTTLTIANSVTNIGDDAFQSNHLTNPVILGSPAGPNVFRDNPIASISYNGTVHVVSTASSTPVTPPDTCFDIDSSSGQITDYKLLSLSALQAGHFCSDRNIIIPSTISGITVTGESSGSFSEKGLTGLSLPTNVTDEVSVGNNNLTSFVLPVGVTVMSDYAYAYNSFTRLTIPTSVTSIDPAAMMGQSPWGKDVQNRAAIDKYIYSDDPVAVQHTYDNLWYVRAYTADTTNPHKLGDFALSEAWEIDHDGNQNGTESDSLGGHIINPASTVIRYQDPKGNTLAPDVTVTGLKTGKSPSSSLDSSDYLHTYLVKESAIPAPLDPYNHPDPQDIADMETGFKQYYRMGDAVTFSPKTISGYFTPSTKTVTLNNADNIVTFTYKPFVTSVPFTNGTVVNGDLTTTPPPSRVHTPLIAKSLLSISGSGGCSHIMSANLLAVDTITATNLPSGTTLLGGLDFSLACSRGGQTGIDYTLGAAVPDSSKVSVFKYNTSSHLLSDITSQVTVATKTIDGTKKTVISYMLTDGGAFDEDAAANGTIKDPLVITYQGALPDYASSGESLAETGVSLWLAIAGSVGAMALGGWVLAASLRKKA